MLHRDQSWVLCYSPIIFTAGKQRLGNEINLGPVPFSVAEAFQWANVHNSSTWHPERNKTSINYIWNTCVYYFQPNWLLWKRCLTCLHFLISCLIFLVRMSICFTLKNKRLKPHSWPNVDKNCLKNVDPIHQTHKITSKTLLIFTRFNCDIWFKMFLIFCSVFLPSVWANCKKKTQNKTFFCNICWSWNSPKPYLVALEIDFEILSTTFRTQWLPALDGTLNSSQTGAQPEATAPKTLPSEVFYC